MNQTEQFLSNRSFVSLFFVTIGMLFMVSRCDSPTNAPEPEQQLLNIPEFGASALPGVATKDGSPTIQASGHAPPAYDLLKQYAKENPENPFIGIVGIWNIEKEKYRYKSIPLEFPAKILEEAKGKTKYYWYRLSASESGILRNFAALIPADPRARDMMTNWLQVKDRDKVVSDDSTKTTSHYELSMPAPYEVSTGKNKDNIDRTQTFYCYKWFPSTGWIYSICEDVVVTGNRDNEFTNGSGGGWPDPGGMPDDGDGDIPDGGSGNNGDTADSAADAFEERIISEKLDPCMQDELLDIQIISVGVGEIVHEFALDEIDPDPALGNLNWELEEGDLPEYVNARTTEYDENTNTVLTKFDSYKFRDASGLGLARTMMHEAVHAYLLARQILERGQTEKTYQQLFDEYVQSFGIEDAQHREMARSFVNDIASGLQQYGWNNGINLNFEYYQDLAWGGLTGTEYFEELSPSRKSRINNRVLIEQTSRNANGDYRTPKGSDAGC